MKNISSLSIVIPAYNEEKHIASTLKEIAIFMDQKSMDYEILVINDGSTDRTEAYVNEVTALYPHVRLMNMERNGGKGKALKKGIALVQKEYCLFLDADNSTKIDEWPKCEERLQQGYDVVIASRHVDGSHFVRPQPFMRRFLGTGYRVMCRALFGLNVSDFNCGFKAYKTPLAQKVFAQMQMTDWTFDVEVFCLLKRENAKIADIPVTWEHWDKASHASAVRMAINSFTSIIKLKKRF